MCGTKVIMIFEMEDFCCVISDFQRGELPESLSELILKMKKLRMSQLTAIHIPQVILCVIPSALLRCQLFNKACPNQYKIESPSVLSFCLF